MIVRLVRHHCYVSICPEAAFIGIRSTNQTAYIRRRCKIITMNRRLSSALTYSVALSTSFVGMKNNSFFLTGHLAPHMFFILASLMACLRFDNCTPIFTSRRDGLSGAYTCRPYNSHECHATANRTELDANLKDGHRRGFDRFSENHGTNPKTCTTGESEDQSSFCNVIIIRRAWWLSQFALCLRKPRGGCRTSQSLTGSITQRFIHWRLKTQN